MMDSLRGLLDEKLMRKKPLMPWIERMEIC